MQWIVGNDITLGHPVGCAPFYNHNQSNGYGDPEKRKEKCLRAVLCLLYLCFVI